MVMTLGINVFLDVCTGIVASLRLTFPLRGPARLRRGGMDFAVL